MSSSSIAPDEARGLLNCSEGLRQEVAKPPPQLVPLEAPFRPHLNCNQAVKAGVRPLPVGDPDSQGDAGPRQRTIQVDAILLKLIPLGVSVHV